MQNLSIDLDSFTKDFNENKSQLVSLELLAEVDTPVSIYLKLHKYFSNILLYESVEGGITRGRYSLIAINPDLIWRFHKDRAEIAKPTHLLPRQEKDSIISTHSIQPGDFIVDEQPSLESLRDIIRRCHIEVSPDIPPMLAGLFGYLSYDSIRLIEDIPSHNPDPLGLPEGQLMRPQITVVFDNVTDTMLISTPIWNQEAFGVTTHLSAAENYELAIERLSRIRDILTTTLPYEDIPNTADLNFTDFPKSDIPEQNFLTMIKRARDYIYAGDIFQVVLSQRYQMPFTLPPFSFYRALRRTNPSPYLVHIDFGDFQISGSSPEILVRNKDGKVTVRPIAGTRKRGRTKEEDQAMEEELLNDAKELAEHLMLLDLGRNDIGRVAKIGSISVTDQFFVERYSHVMHIVSNVEGEPRDDVDGLTSLMAGFPAGTVSGAPKIRAMEIIEELEPIKRGIYAGGIGYFGVNDSMDFCIALRTAVIKDQQIYLQAGAGVVADSIPELENKECQNKARALYAATQEAIKRAKSQNNI